MNKNIYSVDEKGIFQSKTNLEVQLSRSMNPKSRLLVIRLLGFCLRVNNYMNYMI